MKNPLLILVSTIMIACSTSAFAQFDKYNSRVSMQCLGDAGIIQVSLEGDVLIIDNGDGMVLSEKVGSETVVKNGKREQYIMDVAGLVEYFVDFEEKVMVSNVMGMRSDNQCY